ncbi:MAG: hypothetical protein IKW45_05455 [Clostridia bacterium]|nr:hypothetical protein [Clostridia bacterium]
MKTYARIEKANGYKRITTVDDSGIYEQTCLWDDGIITSKVRLTLKEMGYSSLDEFLKNSLHGKKFVFVEED